GRWAQEARMIVAIIVGAVVVVGFGVAWWSSGRARPRGHSHPDFGEYDSLAMKTNVFGVPRSGR
ncbi:hypothetical protein, partial [Nocardioides sp.]|uniref:hypothetical protein n=1 Tax=Nocardioides sp. TaxID=35761 RepID=UPI0035683CB4